MKCRFRLRYAAMTSAFGSPAVFWLVVVLGVVCAWFLTAQKLQPSDDAYITFRHVRNLLEHGRPAWNLSGDPVLGTTTPAFMLTLALFCRVLWLDRVDQAALYLNAVFQFLSVLLSYLIARDLFRRTVPAILFALLIGFNSVSAYISSQGFESTMLTAAVLGGLYFVRAGRVSLGLVLASVAPLIRPEGILLTPLLWGHILLKRRFKKRLLFAYLTVPLAWLAVSAAYYGSPIPHAIQAKKRFPSIYKPYTGNDVRLLPRLPGALHQAVGLWEDPAGTLVLTGSASREFETTVGRWRRWILSLGLPLALICAIARPDGAMLYWLYAPLFLLLYGWIGHTQPWYFPSFVVFSILLLFGGWVCAIDLALSRLTRRNDGRIPWWRGLRFGATLLVFLALMTVNNYSANTGQYDHAHRGPIFPRNPWGSLWNLWEVQRYGYYRKAAEFLNSQTTGDAVVLMSEVGVFGYFYPGDVIDTVGLCSPEALAFYPPPEWDIRDSQGRYYTKANNFTPTEMVMALKPDYVVNSRFYLFNLFRRGSFFPEEYEEISRFGRVWGQPLLVFRRRCDTSSSSPPA
ncbi:MAG: hypothetical protein JSU63_03200 [Phycisphaerales bacterium]|nr:MAG: hypothetical protein JSU63_03200 [Phycisphaerales bacterium]